MDRCPRMRDYLKPEDLNTDACVKLAGQVLKDAAADLITATRQYAQKPDKENRAHLKLCLAFYSSDWFTSLSCVLADGPAVARELMLHAVPGRCVEVTL